METNFGDHLCIVGGHDLLGNWVPAKGIEISGEGIEWKVTVALPAHSLIQYKYVIRSGWADDGTHVAGRPDGRHRRRHSTQKIKDIWQQATGATPTRTSRRSAVAAHEKVKTPEEWEYSNKANVAVLPEANDAVFYQISRWGTSARPP